MHTITDIQSSEKNEKKKKENPPQIQTHTLLE